MQLLETQKQVDDLISSTPGVMLKFSATWCGPCRAVAPVVERLHQQYPNVGVAEIDLDKSPDVVSKYGVTAVPTFVFFKNGQQAHLIKGGRIPEIQSTMQSLN